jgi:hypothetical protein
LSFYTSSHWIARGGTLENDEKMNGSAGIFLAKKKKIAESGNFLPVKSDFFSVDRRWYNSKYYGEL